jgi:hypothetical protein
MKRVDLIGQTLILFLTLVALTPFNWSGLMIGQFCVGVWQMISCVLSVIFVSSFRMHKVIHLTLAILYLLMLQMDFNDYSFGMLTIPSWVLAIFYYSITWMWFLAEPKKGKFLRNISF